MTSRLSLRKETIQRSSSASQTLTQAVAAFTAGQGPKAAHEQRPISLTTLFTLTKD